MDQVIFNQNSMNILNLGMMEETRNPFGINKDQMFSVAPNEYQTVERDVNKHKINTQINERNRVLTTDLSKFVCNNKNDKSETICSNTYQQMYKYKPQEKKSHFSCTNRYDNAAFCWAEALYFFSDQVLSIAPNQYYKDFTKLNSFNDGQHSCINMINRNIAPVTQQEQIQYDRTINKYPNVAPNTYMVANQFKKICKSVPHFKIQNKVDNNVDNKIPAPNAYNHYNCTRHGNINPVKFSFPRQESKERCKSAAAQNLSYDQIITHYKKLYENEKDPEKKLQYKITDIRQIGMDVFKQQRKEAMLKKQQQELEEEQKENVEKDRQRLLAEYRKKLSLKQQEKDKKARQQQQTPKRNVQFRKFKYIGRFMVYDENDKSKSEQNNSYQILNNMTDTFLTQRQQ